MSFIQFLIGASIVALALVPELARGSEESSELNTTELESLIDQQSREIQDLQDRLTRQEAIYQSRSEQESQCDSLATVTRLPVVVSDPSDASSSDCDTTDSGYDITEPFVLDYYSDYEDGFVPVRPVSPRKHPFELKINGWIQGRHHAFSRDVDSWTDNTGTTRPVLNRNAFDVERGRLVLSGYAQDPRLTYFLQLDGDTDGGHMVDFFDYWWSWKFSDFFELQFGKRKVSASRQWLLTARRTRFIDRPMANDFFRPDRTVGLFGLGRVGRNGHYEVMAGNGYQTANVPNATSDNRFSFAATNYFDFGGDFGGQIVDFAFSPDPVVRLGHSFVFSPQVSDTGGLPLEEADFIRLTDGTRLTQNGALSPSVTVSDFDIYLYGIDAAVRWRGWSVNAEVFLRWLEEIRGNADLEVTDLFQRGYYVEGGRFLVPQLLDANFRYSQISGLFGDSSEYAVGINWFPLENPTVKLSFDVTLLDGSPLQNRTSDILVGDDGFLFRTQFQAEF